MIGGNRTSRKALSDTKVLWKNQLRRTDLMSRGHANIQPRGFAMTDLLVSVVDDDDESVHESLPDLLRQLGFAAEVFSSAEAFLASDLLQETRCLILDVAMPGMSGPDLHRELKDAQKHIPT